MMATVERCASDFDLAIECAPKLPLKAPILPPATADFFSAVEGGGGGGETTASLESASTVIFGSALLGSGAGAAGAGSVPARRCSRIIGAGASAAFLAYSGPVRAGLAGRTDLEPGAERPTAPAAPVVLGAYEGEISSCRAGGVCKA